MAEQIISVEASGRVSGLQHKPGKGVDLTSLGKADVFRASEVLWDKERQKWFVQIKTGLYAGKTITHPMLALATNSVASYVAHDPIVWFDTYDEGVEAEISVLNHIRISEGPSALQPVAVT